MASYGVYVNKKSFFLVIVVVNIVLGVMMNLATITRHCSAFPREDRSAQQTIELFTNTTTATATTTTATTSTTTITIPRMGLTDETANYIYHPFFWPAKQWANRYDETKVCLSSMCSADLLHNLELQSLSFEGPISIAVLVSELDFGVAVEMVEYLKQCVDGFEDNVSIHLVYAYSNRPRAYVLRNRKLHCSSGKNYSHYLVTKSGKQGFEKFPQNMLRNIAKRSCHARFTLSLDIDMIASPHMYHRLSAFLQDKTCSKCAYIVPVYEIRTNVSRPVNKQELLKLIQEDQARIYHIGVYKKNQGNSNLKQWEKMGKQQQQQQQQQRQRHQNQQPQRQIYSPYDVLYNISTYEDRWEPIVVLPRTAPGFDERFVGYGFTRNSQIHELHLRGFNFSVLDEPFFIHFGYQQPSLFSARRRFQTLINSRRYDTFKKELRLKLRMK